MKVKNLILLFFLANCVLVLYYQMKMSTKLEDVESKPRRSEFAESGSKKIKTTTISTTTTLPKPTTTVEPVVVTQPPLSEFHKLTLTNIDYQPFQMSSLLNKKAILIVNVASQ